MSKPPIRSAVVLARLLSTEGFTPHLCSCIRRYALRNATRGQRQRYARVRQAFSEMVRAKLSEGDKKILGKFIASLEAMSFNSGLRVGLGTVIEENGKEVEAWTLEDKTLELAKRKN